MMLGREDPGIGDPFAIRLDAWSRQIRAAELSAMSTTVQASANEASGASWVGEAHDAFQAAVAEAVPDLAVLASGLRATADVLLRYADEVAAIQDEQLTLERHIARLEEDREVAGAMMLFFQSEAEDDAYPLENSALAREIRSLQNDLERAADDWDALVERRRRVDADCVAALCSREVRGALYAFAQSEQKWMSADELLLQLNSMTATDMKTLAAAHPELLDKMAKAHPEEVAAWWAGLGAQSPEQQARLIDTLPTFIGALGGLPPLVRVAANRLTAAKRLSELKEQYRIIGGLVGDDDARAMEQEITYLESVVRGEVQLYLYQRDTQSIIEMVGTPGPQTTDVVTYVPGTYTSLHDFYSGGVTQVGEWLNSKDPNIVTFVWKVGPFPGENPDEGGMNLLRIGEANDPAAALRTGRQLASFQREMQASSPNLAAADQLAMGHSWGLAALTSSEVAGATYDQVHSLAGAGMVEQWKPQDGTDYLHWSYTDALSMAQGSGLVYEGNNPSTNPAFSSTIYDRPGDWTLYVGQPSVPGAPVIQSDPGAQLEMNFDGIANHNLIASDAADNQKALRNILRTVQQ